MKNRLVGITLLGICIVAGLITGLFSRSIEAALTLTMNDKTNAGTSGAMMPIPTSAINQLPTPTPSPLPIGVNILAQDTFQRANQTFWGAASDGRTWEGDANKANVFSIAGDAGQVGNAQGAYNALLGPSSTNAEVVASASMNRFDSGNVNIGVVLRWSSGNNWYKALINGSELAILKRVNGSTTQLGAVPFIANAGTSYMIRFRAVGAALLARVWQSGNTEPNNWMLSVVDTALPSGFGGLRVVIQTGVIVKVNSFLETTVSNAM